MQRTPIAVLGASGYSGIEATRLLAQHPRAELKVVASDRWQGETVERRAGVRGPAGRLRYASPERALELARDCAGALAAGDVIVDAASGTTGAGRKASEEMSFSEVVDDFRAYRVLRHQHTPEIAQALFRAAGGEVPLTFTPHLLPLRRGILATCYARLAPGKGAADAGAAFSHNYANEPFIELAAAADEVSLKAVVGTNRCQIGFSAGGADPGRIVVIASIDNLVKGAAGQALQNLNLALGWPETSGLDTLRGFHP